MSKIEKEVKEQVDGLLSLVCNDDTDPETKSFVSEKLVRMAMLGTAPASCVSRCKAKKPAAKKVNPNDARKRYAAAAKKIRDAVKAGKLTPKEAKEKQTALRKRMVLQRFDKNKDGKLCEKEQAAMKKALAERKNKDTRRGSKPRRERGEGPRRGGDKRKRPTRK